jgi:hypothetical protein
MMGEAFRGIFYFLLLGVPGWSILVLSLWLSCNKRTLILLGVLAAVIMFAEFVIFIWMAGLSSATSGSQGSYHTVEWMGLFFSLSLVAYFYKVLAKEH